MRYVIDEIHVQVIVRVLDEDGETVTKYTPPLLRFFNEKTFHEWAAEPIAIRRRDDETA